MQVGEMMTEHRESAHEPFAAHIHALLTNVNIDQAYVKTGL